VFKIGVEKNIKKSSEATDKLMRFKSAIRTDRREPSEAKSEISNPKSAIEILNPK
jgi:hypothetical protein